MFLEALQNSQENTSARLSFSIKLQACNFIKKETLVQVFSCEFCQISKNTLSYRTPLVAASELPVYNIYLFRNSGQPINCVNPFVVLNLFLIWSLFLCPIACISSTTMMARIVCGKDWGIKTGKSDIKFKRITKLEIANEQVFIEIIIKQWEIMVWIWKCGI